MSMHKCINSANASDHTVEWRRRHARKFTESVQVFSDKGAGLCIDTDPSGDAAWNATHGCINDWQSKGFNTRSVMPKNDGSANGTIFRVTKEGSPDKKSCSGVQIPSLMRGYQASFFEGIKIEATGHNFAALLQSQFASLTMNLKAVLCKIAIWANRIFCSSPWY